MDWVERTARLRQWTRSGVRAPHKPLLLLYALSRFQQDSGCALRYSTVEEDLGRLLTEYGPGNRTTPAYPFHHLVSDGVWEVRTERGPGSPGTGVRELRATGATGRLAPELRAALRREPSLLGRMTRVTKAYSVSARATASWSPRASPAAAPPPASTSSRSPAVR